MSDLEELGYLDQPHVSAGRVPSAKAYRLYVDQLLETGRLSAEDEQLVRAHFAGRTRQMEDVIDHAAQVLSSLTKYTAVVLPPTGVEPRIRNIQLVSVADNAALVVIVTDAGVVRDSVIHVSEELDQDALYTISRSLTKELKDCTLPEAVERIPVLMGRMTAQADLLEGLGHVMHERGEDIRPHVAIGGTANMLSYPEYSDMEKARSFLSLMETRDRLADIIGQNGEMAFTVRIGPETGVPEMKDCSIVTMTYTAGNGQQGTIGVIGPTRMQYSRVLAAVNMMGRQLSQLFSTTEDDGTLRLE